MKQRLRILRYVATGMARYAWQSLKNLAKFFIARPTHRDEWRSFFKLYLLHLTGLRRMRRITSLAYAGYEGAGFQAHMAVNAMNFARAAGLVYMHTPFAIIGHADRPMQEWVSAWETLFNLGAGEVACDSGARDIVNYRFSAADLELCFGWRERRDQLAESFKALIPEFRRKYYCNKVPRVTEAVTVAVHIRRGDVSSALNAGLFTSTEKILHTTSAVKSILDSHGILYNIGVYSEGNIADFEELCALEAEYFLNADAIWTMQELVEADILIMSKSSFSYYAGIISDGIKIFEPRTITGVDGEFFPSLEWMIRSPQDDWLPCQMDGAIDRVAFERQLSILAHAKRKVGLKC